MGHHRVHLAVIFPELKFPNVQFKPQKSKQNLHKYQVECKVAGLTVVNPDLKDKKLLMPHNYRNLTAASLASNFFICILNKLKAYLRDVVKVKEKDLKKESSLIRVQHIKYSDIDPLSLYERYTNGVMKGKNIEEMSMREWEGLITRSLVESIAGFDLAKDEITYHAHRYQKCLFDLNNIAYDSYLDPPHWCDRVNSYLDEGTYLESKESTKKTSKLKIGGDEDTTPPYIFAPRIIAIGGGPKTMSLVYHLQFDGNEVCSPCFFNKNLFEFSKTKKVLNTQLKKLTECETRSNIAKHLMRLIIKERINYNYHSGTFDVDYYRDEGIKLVPLGHKPSVMSIEYSSPTSRRIVGDLQKNNNLQIEDSFMEEYANGLEHILSPNEEDGNELESEEGMGTKREDEEKEEECASQDNDMLEEHEEDESSIDSDFILSEEE